MNCSKISVILIMFICLVCTTIQGKSQDLTISKAAETTIVMRADFMTNTEKIRDIMNSIIKQNSISLATFQKLNAAFIKNKQIFEKYGDDKSVLMLLFGNGGYYDHMHDFDLFEKVVEKISSNVQKSTENIDDHSFETAVAMSQLLWPVVRNNATWSQWLIEIVMDITETAPMSMVKYLHVCSSEEFNTVVDKLVMLCQVPERKDVLENELIKIKNSENKYREIIDKFIHNFDNICSE